MIVTSKHNDDEQYIWESDAESFSIAKDPRGNTLGRGTTVSLKLKEEAGDYLQDGTLKELVRKYSQFINFNIYLWSSKVRNGFGYGWISSEFFPLNAQMHKLVSVT